MNPLSLPQSLCTLGTLAHARDRGLFQDPTTQGPDLRPILLTVGGGEGEAGRVATAAARGRWVGPTAPTCGSPSPDASPAATTAADAGCGGRPELPALCGCGARRPVRQQRAAEVQGAVGLGWGWLAAVALVLPCMCRAQDSAALVLLCMCQAQDSAALVLPCMCRAQDSAARRSLTIHQCVTCHLPPYPPFSCHSPSSPDERGFTAMVRCAVVAQKYCMEQQPAPLPPGWLLEGWPGCPLTSHPTLHNPGGRLWPGAAPGAVTGRRATRLLWHRAQHAARCVFVFFVHILVLLWWQGGGAAYVRGFWAGGQLCLWPAALSGL